jgi:hypothetical protein
MAFWMRSVSSSGKVGKPSIRGHIMATGWFVRRGANVEGPLSPGGLKRLAAMGELSPETPVRQGTDGQWVEARRVQGLFGGEAKPASVPIKEISPQPEKNSVPEKKVMNEDDLFDMLNEHDPNEQPKTPEPTAFDEPMPTIVATPIKRPAPSVPVSQPVAARPTPQAAATATKACRFCGETILATAKKCKHCGEFLDQSLRQNADASEGSNKRILPLFLLFLFLGGLGIHSFYAGRWGQGLFLLLGPLGAGIASLSPVPVLNIIGAIIWLLWGVALIGDFFRILFGRYRDGANNRITKWT